MRYINLSILFFLFVLLEVNAQITPPNLKFAGLQENWLYISKDANFAVDALPEDAYPWSSEYSGTFPRDIIQEGNALYILEVSTSRTQLTGQEGYLLHKIDVNTGDLRWVNHNNLYSGNKHREAYSNFDLMSVLNNGNIQVLGFKNIDSLHYLYPQNGFSGNPTKTIIDKNNGETLEKVSSTDTLKTYYNFATNYCKLTTLGNGDIVDVVPNYFTLRSKTLEFFDIRDDMAIDTPSLAKIEYEVSPDVFDGINLPTSKKLNQNTLIALFQKSGNFVADTPKELKLFWIDISDKNSLAKIKEKDITDVVYYPQRHDNSEIEIRKTGDDNIFVHQRYVVNKTYPFEYTNWLAWYDKDGNLRGRIEEAKDEVSGEYYDYILPMGVVEGAVYIAATSTDSRIDILKLAEDSQTTQKVGQIEVENIQDIRELFVWDAKVLENNTILLSIRVVKNFPTGRSVFMYYYNFNMSDLGIATGTDEYSITRNHLTVSPNPAKNIINIELKEPFSGQLALYDMNGRCVWVQNVSDVTGYKIENLNLKSGMYLLMGADSYGNELKEKVIVIE